ncbi:DUF1648 domain-containing protein [uncultured Paludibaculum sp.]|uniref:DUF1648 domain-containing protein n=1 Tax=uncultured Paludibaculum sp. TaxID=1765020 RepID=UPI002AAC481E|nr:DUF1648 domain-containing protein [uncultured Paludibaculum sp.]
MLDAVRFSIFQWPLEACAAFFLLAGLLYPLTQWGTLPERVPSHFNFRGEPDRWAGRWIFGWFTVLEVFLYGMFSYQGHSLDYLLGAAQTLSAFTLLILWTKVVLTGLFAYLNWTIVRVARAQAAKANIPVMMLFSALLVVPVILLRVK